MILLFTSEGWSAQPYSINFVSGRSIEEEPNLIVKEIPVFHNPKPRELLEAVESREGVEVVDKDVRDPEVLHELEVDGQPVGGREVAALGRNLHPILGPLDAEVHREADGELLVVNPQDVEHLGGEQ